MRDSGLDCVCGPSNWAALRYSRNNWMTLKMGWFAVNEVTVMGSGWCLRVLALEQGCRCACMYCASSRAQQGFLPHRRSSGGLLRLLSDAGMSVDACHWCALCLRHLGQTSLSVTHMFSWVGIGIPWVGAVWLAGLLARACEHVVPFAPEAAS